MLATSEFQLFHGVVSSFIIGRTVSATLFLSQGETGGGFTRDHLALMYVAVAVVMSQQLIGRRVWRR